MNPAPMQITSSRHFKAMAGYELTIKDKGDTYLGMDIKFTPAL
jgi:hypothetical protein